MMRWFLLLLIGLSFCCAGQEAACRDEHDSCTPRAECVQTDDGWRVCTCCTLDAGITIAIERDECLDVFREWWKDHCPDHR